MIKKVCVDFFVEIVDAHGISGLSSTLSAAVQHHKPT